MRKYSYWMALDQSAGIGIAAMQEIHQALTSTGLSIQDIFELTQSEIEAEFSFSKQIVAGIVKSIENLEAVEGIYHQLLNAHIEPILFFEDNYPEKITASTTLKKPALLYCYGNKNIMQQRSIALLGSAKISTKADTISFHAGRLLAEHKIIVTGGLSRGAGSLVASGAMENGGGLLGIIPCGILQFNMAERLQKIFNPDRDLIISPFFPSVEISRHNAIYRNEIISELSEAVYIIEMGLQDEILLATSKHISKASIPLYSTEYSDYPEEAKGNKELIERYGAHPVRGRKSGNTLQPNLESIIAHARFTSI